MCGLNRLMKRLRTRISFSLMANTGICHPTSLCLGHFIALLCRKTLGWIFCRLLFTKSSASRFLAKSDPGSLQLSNFVEHFLSLGSMENQMSKGCKKSISSHRPREGGSATLLEDGTLAIHTKLLASLSSLSISRSICLQSLSDDVPLM